MAPKRDDEIAVTIRFPKDLHEEASKAAAVDERSFNLYVVRAVRAQVERDSGLAPADTVSRKKSR